MVKYNDYMDTEVINLCDALNEIPGFSTTGSCSGHGKKPMSVFFNVDRDNINWLLIIGRCTFEYNNHYENHRFRCHVSFTDLPDRPVTYHLESMDMGEEAFEEADKMAESIRYYLKHERFLKLFNLEERK